MRFFDFNFDSDDDESIIAWLAQERAALTGGNTLGVTNFFLSYTGGVTLANSTTETNMLTAPPDRGTKTILPAFAIPGQTFEFFFSGKFEWVATPVLTIRLRLGGLTGTLIETYTPALPAGPGNTAWRLLGYLTIAAGGAGGSVNLQPGAFEWAIGVNAPAQWSGRNEALVAVDFSSSKDWALTAQWDTASASNIFIYHFGCINVV